MVHNLIQHVASHRSVVGHKPTMQVEFAMSAIPPNPDIADAFTRARPFKAGAGCDGRKIGSPSAEHIRAWGPRQASQSGAKRRAALAISGARDFLTFHHALRLTLRRKPPMTLTTADPSRKI